MRIKHKFDAIMKKEIRKIWEELKKEYPNALETDAIVLSTRKMLNPKINILETYKKRYKYRKEKFYGFTLEEIKAELTEEEWLNEAKNHPEFLKNIARSMYDIKLMRSGKIPPDYTSSTICKHCGLVPISPELRSGGHVLGCPWCWNLAQGLPIPKIDENKT